MIKVKYSTSKKNECSEICVSGRACSTVMTETAMYGNDETGGVLFGRMVGNKGYLYEATNPGIHATHSPCAFTGDESYYNYVYPRISNIYKTDPWLIGLWHRHPGSFDRFSHADDITHMKYIKSIGFGCISILVNVDPKPRLTAYYCEYKEGTLIYTKIPLRIGDKHFRLSKQVNLLEYASTDAVFNNKRIISERLVSDAHIRKLENMAGEVSLVQAPVECLCEHEKTEYSREFIKHRLGMTETGSEGQRIDSIIGDMFSDSEVGIPLLEDIAEDIDIQDAFSNVDLKEDIEFVDVDIDECAESDAKTNLIMNLNMEFLSDTHFLGEVYAIGRDETENYFIFAAPGNSNWDDIVDRSGASKIGVIVSQETYFKVIMSGKTIEGYDFIGANKDGSWMFSLMDTKHSAFTCKSFSMTTDLFSRNHGIIETDMLRDRCVCLVGCGSVNSFIALELARAGVGHFVLVDSDILNVHNICRHQLGLKDVGRYKVDALCDAIHNINPAARVETYKSMIQDVEVEKIDEMGITVFVGGGDNRESSAYVNDLAVRTGSGFVSGGLWQRAAVGEVFYWEPDKGMLTYREAFKGLLQNEEIDAEAHKLYFASSEDMKAENILPGVSNDISFVTCIEIKVILDLLARNHKDYRLRVLDYLKQYTLVCNTNDQKLAGDIGKVFPHPLYITDNCELTGKMSA